MNKINLLLKKGEGLEGTVFDDEEYLHSCYHQQACVETRGFGVPSLKDDLYGSLGTSTPNFQGPGCVHFFSASKVCLLNLSSKPLSPPQVALSQEERMKLPYFSPAHEE